MEEEGRDGVGRVRTIAGGIGMDGLLAIATLLSAAYLAFGIHAEGGVPESLSATYYTLAGKGWVFQVAMAAVAILLLPVWLGLSEENTKFLAFFACGGILFTAAAPAFRVKQEGAVHYASAVVCCVSAILWQVFEGVWDVTLFFGFLGLMLFLQHGKWCFCLEIAVIGSVFANLWRLA